MSSYGTIGFTSNSVAATTIALTTTTRTANIGDLVVVRYTCTKTTVGGTSVSDNGTGTANTWTVTIENTDSASLYVAIAYTVCKRPLPIGSLITVAFGASVTFRGVDGIVVQNPQSANPGDSSPTNSAIGSGTAISTGTAFAPSTADWVGVFAVSHGGTTVTPQAGWTEDVDISGIGFETQTIIGSGTATMRGAGTGATSAAWCCVVTVFKLKTRRTPIAVSQAMFRAGTR